MLAIAVSINAESRTERVIGPPVSRICESGKIPLREITPMLGRIPTSPSNREIGGQRSTGSRRRTRRTLLRVVWIGDQYSTP